MIVLAIETATPVRSVAVVCEENVVSMKEFGSANEKGDFIISTIESVLRVARTGIRELDAIAVSIGPGMFTGLRVGLAVAKGLAFACDKPIVPVSTLEALAFSSGMTEEKGWALLDARKGQVYAALFRLADRRPTRMTEDQVGIPEEIVGNERGDVCFFGPGADIYRDRIVRRLSRARHLEQVRPSAVAVGRIGLLTLSEGSLPDPAELVPVYLRSLEEPPKTGGMSREIDDRSA